MIVIAKEKEKWMKKEREKSAYKREKLRRIDLSVCRCRDSVKFHTFASNRIIRRYKLYIYIYTSKNIL